MLALGLFLRIALASASTAGRVVIRTPYYPAFAAVGYGAVWVGAHRGAALFRIDPATNRVSTVDLGGEPICRASVGFGAIFVTECLGNHIETIAVSVTRQKIVRTFPGGWPIAAYGSLWTLNDAGTRVFRFDPRSGVRLASIPTGLDDGIVTGYTFETLAAAGAGAVWIVDQSAKSVVRIDAATNKAVAVIPLPGAASTHSSTQGHATGNAMAFAGGRLWCGNPAGVYEIDPATNRATKLPIRIGNLGAWGVIGITGWHNRLFVRTSGNTVAEIDARSHKVIRRYPATGGGGEPEVGYGSLWIPNSASDTTWRVPLR
jgi:DNA-binding beta-propeller fold protein YncE